MKASIGCGRAPGAFVAAGAPEGSGNRLASDYDDAREAFALAKARRKSVMEEISQHLERRADLVQRVARKTFLSLNMKETGLALGYLGWTMGDWYLYDIENGYVTISGRVREGKRMAIGDIDIPFAFFSLSDRELASIVRDEIYAYHEKSLKDALGQRVGRIRTMEGQIRIHHKKAESCSQEVKRMESFIASRTSRRSEK